MNRILLIIIFWIGFIPVLHAQQLAPAMVWKKCFGGSKEDKANSIIPAIDGGFIVAGYSKSADGDITGHRGSTDFADAWIFKVSASGELEWEKSLGGTNRDEFTQVIRTADGNYLALGSTVSTDGDVVGNTGGQKTWVVKLDRYGNLIWQSVIGNLLMASSVKNIKDGEFVIVGSRTMSIGGENMRYQAIMLMLHSNGSVKSEFNYGGTHNDHAYEIHVLPNDDMLIGYSTDSQDGDMAYIGRTPGGGILRVNHSGAVISKGLVKMESNTYGIKPLPNGNLLVLSDLYWCMPMNNTTAIGLSQVQLSDWYVSQSKNYAICNTTSDPSYQYSAAGSGSVLALPDGQAVVAGFSTDPAVATLGSIDAFMAKTDWTADGGWKKCYGGSGFDAFTSIAEESEYSWTAAGYTNSNDGDVSGNHGDFDCWVVQMGNINLIKGTVFADYNLNGTKDINEPLLSNILVQSQKGTSLSASAAQNGAFSNSVDTGVYSTNVLTTLPYYSMPAPQISSFTSYNQADNLSFALQPIPGKRDYKVDLFTVTQARPGFEVDYQLQYQNVGTDTLQSSTIKMIKDSRLQFNSASPAQVSVIADTIIWNITNVLPRGSGSISIHFTAAAPPALNNDDTLVNLVTLDTTGDLAPANNIKEHKMIVTGSYDPNDKQESGGGSMHPSAISNGGYLTYTIRFQNTGTDTAFTVVVRDTLSAKTDPSSFEMVSASHPYQLAVKNGNIFNWTFKNILLVDSNRNEPLSHGFITYRVKPRNNLVLKDSIHNSASIYFDFNLPVLTNTQTTVVKVPPPRKPVVAGIPSQYCTKAGSQKLRISNLPEAASATTAKAFLNNQELVIEADSSFAFNPSALPAGKNTIKIVYENIFGTEISQYEFQVMAAAEPEVNVQSSINHITNLSSPVKITAIDAAGGGVAPVFTFAKDRVFTMILQQGASPVLNKTGEDFVIGDNWIYVRMQTSETCFNNEFNTDSIKISRDITTGIADPDVPGQTIKVFPNPFKGQFRIIGLSSSKNYSFVISNPQGMQVHNKKAVRSSSVEIRVALDPKGVYLLSIYDDQKKRLIGTIPLISK